MILSDYKPIPGVADELMDSSGAIRPVWKPFIDRIGALSAEDIAARFARGEQYLRDAGVFFRHYDQQGSSERDWPLSHIPLIIGEQDWRQIEAGLIQRADLLERVVADLYGDNMLVADGHLPASLVANNPEWLRPIVGIAPTTGDFLRFIAFEIGRGPDGNWWVLGDRTQAPSGIAFALENRVATGRVFPDLFPAANVHRLAGFFRTFRDSLHMLRREPESRVAILTPGPFNETYYEHAYIARYLGFMLLEGEDLTVERGQVMVRTVAGPRPLSVLWRRIDSSWVDPLELDESSQLGTPGLVDALRRQTLTMVNMPGTGVLETRALLAFLPRICEALTGEQLILPNIATWWCGQEQEQAHVQANLGNMMVGPALSTRLPFDTEDQTLLSPSSTTEIIRWIETEGPNLVGQEAVTLSTTPAWIDGKLVPRPMSLRVFLARTPDGWQVMPGGFARIGRTEDATAVAMQRGGSVADVWVIGDEPVTVDTMMATATTPYTRAYPAVLPSRAAENLFWLGRYSERAEDIMRLVRAYQARLAENGAVPAPLIDHIETYLEGLGIDPDQPVPEALRQALAAALNCASRIRDRFSVDGWAAINDLAKTARRLAETVVAGDDAAHAMGVLLRKVSGFSGLVHENMYRFIGWRFLTLGRSIERASAMASLLASLADPEAPQGTMDFAIEVGDSVLSHRRRFAAETQRDTVIDLLALDPLNPRSITYHLNEIREQAAALPDAAVDGAMSPLMRAILKTHTALEARTPAGLDTAALLQTRQEIWNISDLLSAAYWH